MPIASIFNYIGVIVLVVLVLILVVSNIHVVQQSRAYVVERLGAYSATWNVGLHLKIPFIERVVKKVSLKEQVADFDPQPVITKDNVTMQIDTPAYNLPYYYWFYDAETASFQPYGSWTYQLEIDAENKTCICRWHVTPEYYTDTYRPDGEGGLYLARRDTEVYYSADGVKSFTEVYTANEKPLAYADLDRDGANEILVLTSSEPDEFAMRFYTLDAKKYDGTALFTEEFGTYHVGWNTLFLVYGEDENGVWGANLLRYLPFVGAGVGNYRYDLLSYAGGQERYHDGNTITFVLEADDAVPVPDIDRATQADFERFREDVTELLRGNVTLLFSTDPVVCADLAYPMDGSYTEQAVENILSDLDAQALWLYPADAKGA